MKERLIDANALIRCIDEKNGEDWHSCSLAIIMGYIDGLADAISTIDDQITIDAEPVRHGKWIYGENSDGFDGYSCSHCMTHFAVDDVSDYHYCPYCGAKMDEKKEFDCNDCYYSMQNCNDRSICCEDETALCDDFEPVVEVEEK